MGRSRGPGSRGLLRGVGPAGYDAKPLPDYVSALCTRERSPSPSLIMQP